MSSKELTKRSGQFPAVWDDFFKPWNDWFSNGFSQMKPVTIPAVNITDSNDEYKLSLAAPGLKKGDFHIDVDGNMLTISCEKEENKEEKDSRHTRKEYNYQSFSRTFTIPEEVSKEKIEASYDDGILKVKLPKKEEAKRMAITKNIQVK
ncbi:Hsp20/alpha crystallin family protein [Paraflavitalea soli]|uniref:Hsp20/alpha crystallin family protein n=1 Tax=Paraflavitalea soli TaxID=2315862 RepID=A0A3B7MIB5_9BACT|nr:Hsp20/alpha crystallin family protein [Paraflavitalea soli]AXY74174.1 Hsp20/alpha crystallin family protein [Paraflavitalea soli]